MNKITKLFWPIALLCVALALAACRNPAAPPASPQTTPATVAATADAAPTEAAATAEGDGSSGMVTTVAAPTATAEVAASGATALPVPDPSLFDVAWDERALFEANLVDAADAHLPALQGATVYHLDVELSSDATTLAGRQEVHYTNREEAALDALYLRLFPNLADGQTDIQGAWVNGQAVEPAFELRDSVLILPLQPALAPGASVVVRLDFATTIPTAGGGNYGTFVFNRDILALAHFYPMVAVYDDEGWNVEIAPQSGDVVYADSAFYLVQISAPAGLGIAASGVEIEGGSDGERQRLVFAAGPVRDFYLAASQGFAVVSEQVGDTLVNSYAFPELEPAARYVLQWSAAALRSFNERFGPYPYTELDLVTTPTLALGVEYPGIIAINMDMYDPQTSRYPPEFLESTVAHEVAHQWFYGVIGNDQLDDPWLDESLSQYATYLYFQETGQSEAADAFRQSLVQRWQAVRGAEIPIGQPVAAYQGPEYSAIVYGRGALFFEALAAEIGQETFDVFMRDYYATLKYDIATPERFQTLAEQHCACELDALFTDWVTGE